MPAMIKVQEYVQQNLRPAQLAEYVPACNRK